MHQFFDGTVLHPVTRCSGTQGALRIGQFRLPRHDKDANTRKFRREIFDPADGIATFQKRFDEQHIWAMVLNELVRLLKSMCGAAHTVQRVAANDRDQALLANNGIADRHNPVWLRASPSCSAFLHGSRL